MVQSHFSKQEMEDYYDVKFTDDEWDEFTDFGCDLFDVSKGELMVTHVSLWKDRDDEN